MKEELGMVLARNEAKRLSERKMDFSNIQEEMEFPRAKPSTRVQTWESRGLIASFIFSESYAPGIPY